MRVSEVMSGNVKTISESEHVSKALSLMDKSHFKELPVISNDKLVGIVTMHSIMTIPNYSSDLKVSSVMFMPPILNDSDDIFVALKLMKETGIHGLPVMNGYKVVGFISDYDILKSLKGELKNLSVNDVMIENPATLLVTDNIAKAKRILYYDNISILPVVDPDGKLVGIFKESYFMEFMKPRERMSYAEGGEGESMNRLNPTIGEVMNTNFFLINVGEPLTKIVNLMLSEHIDAIIITDDSKSPIGYVDRFDVISYLSRKLMPRGVMLNFSGMKLDFDTNNVLSKVVSDHLSAINYLAKGMNSINVYIKGVHEGEGVRKFQLDLKVSLNSGVNHHVSKTGYALRECLDEALTDVEKMMKKSYKKTNP